MTARFRFRLERVLAIRAKEEERERMLFGAAMREKLRAEMALDEVRERIRAAIETAAARMKERVMIEDLRRSHDYRMALLRREAEAEAHLAASSGKLEERRAALIEARKRKRVLERLREKARERWRLEVDREEQDDLDEMGLAAHLRGREEAARAAAAMEMAG